MPSFPIIDTHIHIWDPQQLSYPWLAGAPALDRPMLVPDLDAERGRVEIERFVFVEADVEASRFLDEAVWVSEVAAAEPRLAGIVAHASLERGDAVKADLERLVELPLLRGIRRLLQGEADPAYCLRPAFVAGVKALAPMGLVFDICVYHHQLEHTVALVRRCPEVAFILDHIGKPAIRDGLLDPWRAHIQALGACDNVWCKMSGVATEADHEAWTTEELRPYIDHVFESFGLDRVMFGGDWPVSTLAIAYPRWVEVVDEALAGCSEDERRKVFRENARRFYRLG